MIRDGISNVDDCVNLQNDLNSIYQWVSGFVPKGSNISV